MNQLPEPKRRKIRAVVLDILRTADLETATEQSVRTTAAKRLGIKSSTSKKSTSLVESFLLSTAEKGTHNFVPEEQQSTAELPQQKADVSLPNGRFVDSYANSGRVICKELK